MVSQASQVSLSHISLVLFFSISVHISLSRLSSPRPTNFPLWWALLLSITAFPFNTNFTFLSSSLGRCLNLLIFFCLFTIAILSIATSFLQLILQLFTIRIRNTWVYCSGFGTQYWAGALWHAAVQGVHLFLCFDVTRVYKIKFVRNRRSFLLRLDLWFGR